MTVRWWIRIAFGLVVGAATAFLSIRASQRVGLTQGGAAADALVIPAAIVAGLSGAVEVAMGVSDRIRDERSERHRREIERRVFALWDWLTQRYAAPGFRDQLGVHVWLVPRWHYRFFGRAGQRVPISVRSRMPTPAMWRPAKMRLVDHLDPTNVKWTRGKGAIGMCWRTRGAYYFDANLSWAPLANATKPEWRALDDQSVTLNLGYEEFERVRRNYGQVLAMPIWKRITSSYSAFVGCVVIDLPLGYTAVDLNERTFYAALRSCADRVAETLWP